MQAALLPDRGVVKVVGDDARRFLNGLVTADMAKVTAALADLGCKDPEGVKKEQEGIYEIDDAKCKMGTMDIKLDKDFSVILISRY